MKRIMGNIVLSLLLFAFVLNCGGGIDTSMGPDDDGPFYQEALIRRLNDEPYSTWSPFGDKVLFCQNGNIWLMDTEGSNLKELIIFPDEDKKASHPDWKVHDRIIFQLNYPSKSEIYTKLAFTGMAEKVNFDLPEGGSARYQFPTLSPDGEHIVFTFNDNMYLSEYPPRGKATLIDVSEKINKECEWVDMYSWSVHGKIAFSAKTPEGTNIYVMDDVYSKTISQITEGNVRDFNPSWSHNGEYIAFDSNRFTIAGEHNICLIKADGKGLEKLSKGSGKYPRFHPQDDDLLYSSKMVEGWRINLIHDVIQKE